LSNRITASGFAAIQFDELNALGFLPDFAGVTLEDRGFSNCSNQRNHTALPYSRKPSACRID